jgi:hypothetical protein
MNQFILHSALDIVEEVQWVQREMYLKTIDRFNNLMVSCFLSAGSPYPPPCRTSARNGLLEDGLASIGLGWTKVLTPPL